MISKMQGIGWLAIRPDKWSTNKEKASWYQWRRNNYHWNKLRKCTDIFCTASVAKSLAVFNFCKKSSSAWPIDTHNATIAKNKTIVKHMLRIASRYKQQAIRYRSCRIIVMMNFQTPKFWLKTHKILYNKNKITTR